MTPVSRISGRALAALLPDLRTLPGPVYAALASAITALVLDGRVATQTKLPSERELAAALDVSRATVTAAYDELRSTRFLTSRTGSGSFVTVPPGSRLRPSLARWDVAARGVAAVTDGEFGDVIDLSCAALPAPAGVVENAMAAAARMLPCFTCCDGYDPSGLIQLRQLIADRYAARGVPTDADQIVVTSGALHAWDLLLRLLVGPGDRVLTELPTYPGALDAIRGNGARIVAVPMSANGGWQLDQLIGTIRQTAPRLAYLIPDYHNPTGALMPDEQRQQVLQVARQAGSTVVVDESFIELGFEGAATPCAAIDPSVISIGSLSKPIWGGLRTGWIRTSVETAHRLAALRAGIDMGGPILDQLVAAELFADLDEIVAARVAELRPQRDGLLASIAEHFPRWQTMTPRGGLSAWVALEAPMSTSLTLHAAQAGLALVPGSRFGVDGTLERFLRLPFSLPVDRLDEAVRRMASVHHRLGSTPARQLVVA